MSYTEYYDLFDAAQKRDCPYRAFLIDVKNSKVELNGANEKEYFKIEPEYLILFLPIACGL